MSKTKAKAEKSGPSGGRRATTPLPSAAPARGQPRLTQLWVGLAVGAAVFLSFWPALSADFVDWDDPDNFLKNPHYRGLGPQQLRWMFTTFHMGHYQPLSWLTLGFDHLWGRAVFGNGLDPRSYHLTNMVLHSVTAVLVYLLALRLFGGTGGRGDGGRAAPSAKRQAALATDRRAAWVHLAAALAAVWFGAHPLRAESVAWATERRDVLSSLLLVLTVLCYWRACHVESRRRVRWLGVTLLVYAASMTSRAMAMTLPLVLLVLDWYPLRRLVWPWRRVPGTPWAGVWLEKLPFLLVAAVLALVARQAQLAWGQTSTFQPHGLAQACYGLVFYLHKTLLPLGLSPIYELKLPVNVWSARYLVPLGLVAATAAVLALLAARGRARAVTAAALAYVLLPLPVLGLVQSGSQEVADRYSYLPGIVLAVLAGGGALRLWRAARAGPSVRYGLASAGVVAALVLSGLTWRQTGVWRNTETLWTHAARTTPNASIARNGYGFVLLQQKRYDEAAVHLRRAIELQPTNEKAHHNLWDVYRAQGRGEDLIAAYRDAIRVHPAFADAHLNLGNALAMRGELAAAGEAQREALRLRPNDAQTHANLATTLYRQGDDAGARQHYEAALRLDPANVSAREGLAYALHRQGRTAEALAELERLLQINPNYEPARKLRERLGGAAQSSGPPPP